MHRLLILQGFKGGTGKSTTVVNASVELAYLGWRVLVVDTDRQASVHMSFANYNLDAATAVEDLITDPELEPHVAEVPLEPRKPRNPLKQRRLPKPKGSLAVLPCTAALGDLTTTIAGASYSHLDRILGKLDADFDICLIDRQGALTAQAHMATRAADSYLFVGEPAAYAAGELFANRDELLRFPGRGGKSLVEIGALFTRTSPKARRLREYAEDYRTKFDPPIHVFPEPIRQSERVFDDPLFGQPTAILDPWDNASEDYRRFAGRLTERLAELGVKPGERFDVETPTPTAADA